MKKILLYCVLSILAFIVLLPLFWMLITAVKKEGQAFKMTFIPQTKVETNEFDIDDLKPKSQTYAIFEVYNESAQSINVAGSFQGWKEKDTPLKNVSGIWTARVENIAPGAHEYKFIVNGKWDEGDNKKIIIKEGRNVNSDKPVNATTLENNKLTVKFRKESQSASLLLNNGKIIALNKDSDGCFTGSADIDDSIKSYKFQYSRSFGEAVRAIYTFENFKLVLDNPDFQFGKFFVNSVIVSTLCAFLTALLCTMAGYAFAKKDFIFREKLFLLLLGSMMIPGMIFMVPQFAITAKFGWINTYWGMVIPHLGNVFGVFLIRQYIKTIPNSLFEAATIDGANEFQIFRIIIIPLAMPIIVTLFLLTFLGQWSNFLWQLIVNTPDSPCRTLPVGMALFKGQYAIAWERIMAGSCFSIVPIAILFLVAQKFFMEGMTGGAVKE